MNEITRSRCFRHPAREAVARCPECGRFFCRECVTEHGERVICAGCLARLADRQPRKKSRIVSPAVILHLALAFMLTWLLFYAGGRLLLRLPTSFHEGTVWRELALELP